MQVTELNKLPVIIDGVGIYIRRDGGRVNITEIVPYKGEHDPLTVTAFECKGQLERLFRGILRFRGLDSWHVSGRKFPLKESSFDIVSKEGDS
jgi:hypothetical protein